MLRHTDDQNIQTNRAGGKHPVSQRTLNDEVDVP